jgi:hypothetical protein
MIQFKTGKNKWKIGVIRIKDYYAISAAMRMKHDEISFSLVSMLSGCPVEDLKSLAPTQWLEIWTELEVYIERDLTRGIEARTKITHDGVEYGLVNFDDMSIGEFADIDVILADPNMDGRLHEILAILYRPVISSNLFRYKIAPYDAEGYRDRCKLFLDLPVKHAKAVMGFFLSFAIAYSGLTTHYLALPRKEKKILEKTMTQAFMGRGTKHSFISLMKTLWISAELPNSVLEKHLTSLFGEETRFESTRTLIGELVAQYKTSQ